MYKLVIDSRMINSSGIGRYIQNILPDLIQNYQITLIGEINMFNDYPWVQSVDIIEIESNIYSIKEQIELSEKVPECDLFWSPHYNIPILPIRAKKRMVTIHDVYHLAFYETLSLPQKIYSKFMIKQAVKKSDIILTVSEFSKNEIIKYTNTDKKIDIINNAIGFEKFKVINDEKTLKEVKNKYGLPDDFLLFVGNVKPHKNLKNLLLAIKSLNQNLVIVGKKDGFITGDDEIASMIKKNNLENRIYFTGYVEDRDIPVIYNIAKLFVFPSLYEGFGIPPLEAQACGCPVICSNVASLPEVGGDDSVVYCDPYSVDDIKEKIELVLSDENLQEKLREKGFENIKRFSWEHSANKIMEILKGLE